MAKRLSVVRSLHSRTYSKHTQHVGADEMIKVKRKKRNELHDGMTEKADKGNKSYEKKNGKKEARKEGEK